MQPIILYRQSSGCMEIEELKAALNWFPCFNSRVMLEEDCLVIPRYSLLPFAKELEDDVIYLGSKLINSYSQFEYIADLKNYVNDLKELTPRTWDKLEDLPENCSFILKGATNSKKFYWNSCMFAENKQRAIEVHSELWKDELISRQEIYIRQYIPLKTYFVGLQGLPITEEYRFFVAYQKIISGGFYWSLHIEEINKLGEFPDPKDVPLDFLQEVIKRVGDKNNFYTIDVARTANNDWIVIELNSGEMAGLSENNPNVLYSNLLKQVNENN